MDGKKLAKILTGIALIVFGFITRNIALERYSRNSEIFEWLGILMIVFGVVDVIVALAQKSENSNKENSNTTPNQKNQSSSMFVNCPYCGEENSIRNEKCFRCHRIINTHASVVSKDDIPTDGWVCPKCKKVNAKYVGTCGCGERKP